MKKAKRWLSIVLAVMMILSVFIAVPTTANAAIDFLFPVQNGRLAYYYGNTAEYVGFHSGIDIHSTDNDTIYAAYDGTVTNVSNSCNHIDFAKTHSYSCDCAPGTSFGNYVKISNSNGTVSYYGHLLKDSIMVSVGNYVKKGQAIAKMGSSGYSSGKHLHYEVWQNGSHINVNPVDNGGLINYSYTGYGGTPVPTGNDPQGNVESLTSPEANKINVSGWAFDKDDVTASIDIHIYIGGSSASGVPGYRIQANKTRNDLKPHFPELGNNLNHGFNETITVSRTGEQEVYIYAYNIGGGAHTLLAKKTVNILSNSYGTNNTPQGNLESITSDEAGTINVSGWAFDKDDVTAAIDIHVYVGGIASSGAPGYRIAAYKSRADLKPHFPELGDNIYHGFNETINVSKTGEQEVFVYAIGLGNGGNLFLGSGKVNIAIPVPETEPTPSESQTTEATETQSITEPKETETVTEQIPTETVTEPKETVTEKPTETVTEPSETETTPVPNGKLYGDANCDNNVNIKDATAIQKHVASIKTLSAEGVKLADVDGSNSVSIKDATYIQKYIAALNGTANVGKKYGS